MGSCDLNMSLIHEEMSWEGRSRVAKVMTVKHAVRVFQFPIGALPTTETGKAKVRLGSTCLLSQPLAGEGRRNLRFEKAAWATEQEPDTNRSR